MSLGSADIVPNVSKQAVAISRFDNGVILKVMCRSVPLVMASKASEFHPSEPESDSHNEPDEVHMHRWRIHH